MTPTWIRSRPIITKGSIFSSHSLECLVSFDPNIVGHSCADSMNSNPTYLPGKVTCLSLPGNLQELPQINHNHDKATLSRSIIAICLHQFLSVRRCRTWHSVCAMIGRWLDAHLDHLVLHLTSLIIACFTLAMAHGLPGLACVMCSKIGCGGALDFVVFNTETILL